MLLTGVPLSRGEMAALGAGFAMRLLCIMLLVPQPIDQWFAPFLGDFLSNPSPDPWTQYLQAYPAVRAFPYGIAMFLVLLPLSWAGSIISTSGTGIGISCTLLLADAAVWLTLRRSWPDRKHLLMLFWWLSPLAIATGFWVGQLDVIPIVLLLMGIICLKSQRFQWAGTLFALSISAKLSTALALPFVLLYFVRNKRLWPYAASFLIPFCALAMLLLGLPLFSLGYHRMTIGTSELGRLFDLTLTLGDANLYLTPIIYACVVYGAWRTKFLTFDLLASFIALGMLVIVLGTSTPPGWQIWAWPFLIIQVVRMRNTQRFCGYVYGLTAAANQILFWPVPSNLAAAGFSFLPVPQQGGGYSFLLSLQLAVGIVLMLGIMRYNIQSNAIFRIGRRPVSIAIAGDSGTGKDTLAEHLIGLFGANDTTHLSGDDYHRWDRKNTSWKLITHLNPRANDLKRFFEDIHAILLGKRISRRHYQHSDGHFSQIFSEKTQNFFIVSGLHTLVSRAATAQFDVRIFMEMDERLRAFFKCQRDSKTRGHKLEDVLRDIERRKPDAARYIMPQKNRADIVFIRRPLHPEALENNATENPQTSLEIHLRSSWYHDELARQLMCLCNAVVEVDYSPNMNEAILNVSGEFKGEDMRIIAERYLPETQDLLLLQPEWSDGIYGLMQLVILYHLTQRIKDRQ